MTRATAILLWCGCAAADSIPVLSVEATLALPKIQSQAQPTDMAPSVIVDREGESWVYLDARSGKKFWQIANKDLINQHAGHIPSYAFEAGDRWVHLDGHYESPRVRVVVINLKKQHLEWEAFLGEATAAEYLVAQNLSRDGKIYGVAHIRDRRKKTGKGYITTVRFLDLENKRRLSDAEFTHQPDYGLGARELISLAGDTFAILLWRDLVFWDVRAGKILATFEGVRRDSGPIHQDYAVSQDGSKLALVAVMDDAAGSAHRRAQVYSADGRLLKLLRLPGDSPLSGAARYCDNDRYVVLTGEIETKPRSVPVTAVWDLASNRLLTFGNEPYLHGGFAGISRDCSRLAFRPAERSLSTVSLPSGKSLSNLEGQDYLEVSPDARWAFQNRGGVLSIYSLLTGGTLQHLRQDGERNEWRWSADRDTLEYVEPRNGDKMAQRFVLKLPEQEEQGLSAAQAPPGAAQELRFGADDRTLLARYSRGAVKWNTETRRAEQGNLDYDFNDSADEAHLPPSSKSWLVVHRKQDQGVIMDMLTGQRYLTEPAGRRHELTSVQDSLLMQRFAIDVDSGEYYVLGSNGVERFRADGTRIQTIAVPPPAVRLLAARAGKVALVADDRSVRVLAPLKASVGMATEYAVQTRTTLPAARFLSSCLFLYHATLSADGRYLQLKAPLCTRASGPTHAVYDLATGIVVGPGDMVSPFSSRHARYAILSASGETLQIWDLNEKKVIANLARGNGLEIGHELGYQPQRQAALSANGRIAAANTGPKTVRVWQVDTRQVLGELHLTAGITAVAIDTAGRRVAVATQDEQIILTTVPAAP